MEVSVYYLIYRMPAFREKIEQLFREDGDFRDLCHDYRLCLISLWRWEINPEQNRELIEEYRALLGELEKEVEHFLESKNKSS